MIAHIRDEPALAVDTESNSLYVYEEQVCLIQITVPGTDYLVDPLALDDISALGPLLADPETLKVLHGAEYDVSVLHRDFGFAFENLFDTMWASRILGWSAHGLAALLKEHFGVKLNKKYQRANWGVRPLPPPQLDYARLDTHYLLPLHEVQSRQLDEQDRWPQARHRFSRLVNVRWDVKGFSADDFWRLSGARELDDVGRGVLRELFILRDQWARAENRPVFRVISNKALVSIAGRRPRSRRELQQIKGVSPRMAKRYGRGLLKAIARGEDQPLSWRHRPRPSNGSSSGHNGRLSPEAQARFDALRLWRNAAAEARGVAPDIILTNQILWEVAHQNPRSREDLSRDGVLAKWQREEFGDDLLAVLRKVRASA
jgi:ribonuclease D